MVKRICCWLKNKFAKKELALPEHAWLVRSIELPDGSTMVEDGEFEGMSALRNVVLPSSILKIGSRAFEGCPQLLELSYHSIYADWYALVAHSPADCFAGSSIKTVHCLDMHVSLEPSSEG